MSSFLYLNTRDREYGTNNNATFYVTRSQRPQNSKISLESVVFPNFLYPISTARNNYLLYFQENGDPTITYMATLDVDIEYTAATLAAEVATKMTAASGNAITYTAAVIANTGKLELTPSGGTMRIVDGTSNVNYEIGWDTEVETGFFGSPRTGTGPIDVSGTKYVDVITSLGGFKNYVSGATTSTFARIPVNGNFGEVVIYTAQMKHEIQAGENLEQIQIALRDDRGFITALPGNGHVSYSFMVEPIVNANAIPGF